MWGAWRHNQSSMCPREGGDPDWAPAFAGEHGGAAVRYAAHPGGGRGPIGGRLQRSAVLPYFHLSNWAPAFAGVVVGVVTALP
ncbi:hypothetical protein SPHINGO391_470174 [Sphingomonas aurantiaca]|uniref:Uncharacterized protein n=1 Tax=Sphingomonas aurantiaca TaxID=185949 RepID=A0A5E7ZQH6_9SPHN|nr:hypothetical protein SPHINGO391_470174 [Sphingomonas aurantiaca]